MGDQSQIIAVGMSGPHFEVKLGGTAGFQSRPFAGRDFSFNTGGHYAKKA